MIRRKGKETKSRGRESDKREKCFVLCCPQTNFFGVCVHKIEMGNDGEEGWRGVHKGTDDNKVY